MMNDNIANTKHETMTTNNRQQEDLPEAELRLLLKKPRIQQG